jgi:hypothetical protein
VAAGFEVLGGPVARCVRVVKRIEHARSGNPK